VIVMKAILINFDNCVIEVSEKSIKELEYVVFEITSVIDRERIKVLAEELFTIIRRLSYERLSLDEKEVLKIALQEFLKRMGEVYPNLDDVIEVHFTENPTRRFISDDFKGFLKAVHGKYRLYLFTTEEERFVRRILRNSEIDPNLFDRIYSMKDYEEKSFPELLKVILKENKLKPEECVLVGGDVVMDIIPAKLSGLKTVLFSRFLDGFSSSYEELEKIIEELGSTP